MPKGVKRQPKPQPTPAQMRLATLITERLFTAGNGREATRLLLWDDDLKMDFGGWGRGPAAAYIADILAEQSDPIPAPPPDEEEMR
jgi:hypothetical protein